MSLPLLRPLNLHEKHEGRKYKSLRNPRKKRFSFNGLYESETEFSPSADALENTRAKPYFFHPFLLSRKEMD